MLLLQATLQFMIFFGGGEGEGELFPFFNNFIKIYTKVQSGLFKS